MSVRKTDLKGASVRLAAGGWFLAKEKTIFPLCLSGNLYNLVGSGNCVTISCREGTEGRESGESNAGVGERERGVKLETEREKGKGESEETEKL